MSKNITCSNLTPEGADKLESELDEIWQRLGDLKELIQQALDEPHSNHERDQLLDLARITGAHAYFILEIGVQHRATRAIPDAGLREMITLIEQHCDDGAANVRALINEQSGFVVKAVRML